MVPYLELRLRVNSCIAGGAGVHLHFQRHPSLQKLDHS